MLWLWLLLRAVGFAVVARGWATGGKWCGKKGNEGALLIPLVLELEGRGKAGGDEEVSTLELALSVFTALMAGEE